MRLHSNLLIKILLLITSYLLLLLPLSIYHHLNSFDFANHLTRFHVSVIDLAGLKKEEVKYFKYGFDKLTLVGATCIPIFIGDSTLNSDLKVLKIS